MGVGEQLEGEGGLSWCRVGDAVLVNCSWNDALVFGVGAAVCN